MKVLGILSEKNIEKKKRIKVSKKNKPKKEIIPVDKEFVLNYLINMGLYEPDLESLKKLIENNEIITFSGGYITLIKFPNHVIWIKDKKIKMENKNE